jgi:hypothetical protein
MMALTLIQIGLACGVTVNTYAKGVRQPGRWPFRLDSWQRQLGAISLLAALPICALVLAVVIPQTSPAFQVVFQASITGWMVLLIAAVVARVLGGGFSSRSRMNWQRASGLARLRS